MKLQNYYNIESKTLDLKNHKKPFFHDLSPDFKALQDLADKYMDKNHIVVVGNGGAVNSFLVLYRALYTGDKQIEIVNSMEPDLINSVKKRHPVNDTIVIVSSTSGTNVGALEIMSQFGEYERVVITADNDGALKKIAKSEKLPILFVPHITDRYLTSGACAYFPLILLGLDVHKIDHALHAAYEMYTEPDSDPMKLSSMLFELENKGYTEVFVPIYSHKLEAFSIYIMQLMHESVSKNGKSQSFLVVAAPESQHHSNQRFFGGRKNIAGLFIRSGQSDTTSKIEFNDDQLSISLRDGSVKDISGVALADAFQFESEGTLKDAINNKIPTGVLEIPKIDEANVAELIAFWHYMAVYSSWLRNVDPFDQPQVEKSKEIAFEMRKKAH